MAHLPVKTDPSHPQPLPDSLNLEFCPHIYSPSGPSLFQTRLPFIPSGSYAADLRALLLALPLEAHRACHSIPLMTIPLISSFIAIPLEKESARPFLGSQGRLLWRARHSILFITIPLISSSILIPLEIESAEYLLP